MHARILRENMRHSWPLPADDLLRYSGPEWLLHAVGTAPAEEVARLILILWRAWFIRNEWVHAKRWIRSKASVSFLSSYWEALSSTNVPKVDDKGKLAASP